MADRINACRVKKKFLKVFEGPHYRLVKIYATMGDQVLCPAIRILISRDSEVNSMWIASLQSCSCFQAWFGGIATGPPAGWGGGDSTRHQEQGLPWINFPTICSFPSLPQIPDKMSESKKTERKTQTFEYENPVYFPDVVKSSRIAIRFEEYTTRDICKNIYRVLVPIVVNWVSELIPGCIRRCVRKTVVEVWVFRES